jgi:MoCo/4Fe-4S cofactor protein with predicted Tat translocation signal
MLDFDAFQDRIAQQLQRFASTPRSTRPDGGDWRSLRHWAGDPELADQQAREFPDRASQWDDEPSRRQFLRLMSASLALAGACGCRAPDEQILPYVEMPEQMIPGKPLYFATAMPLAGHAMGLVVESHMGRPTKIEGNPSHPASRGATSAIAQASILDLYDPDRSRAIRRLRTVTSRDVFESDFRLTATMIGNRGGAGLRVLTESTTSPTLVGQLQQILERWPDAKWYQYGPVMDDEVLAGAELAFGQPAVPSFDFRNAGVVLALEADFLDATSWPISCARDFMDRRRLTQQPLAEARMNRLYAVESTPTLVGSKADHRWRLSPPEVRQFARALAARLGVATGPMATDWPPGVRAAWGDALAADLNRGGRQRDGDASLVIVGREQPPEVHALAHAMNALLGNVGKTVRYHEPIGVVPAPQLASLRDLTEQMNAGEVEMLLILGGNPVFDAPADFDFAAALPKVGQSLHMGIHFNETAAACRWHLPGRHFLESWSDARAYDGTASIIQPLIAPLYGGWSEHELLSELVGEPQTAYDLVRHHWRTWQGGALADEFDSHWETALKTGIVTGSQAPLVEVSLRETISFATADDRTSANAEPDQTCHVLFRPDATIWDGRYANNGWLQELPKPLTKLTWDNAALIAPETAARLGVTNGQVVRLSHGDRRIELPVWILPGQADGTITTHFGYGRRVTGRVGQEAGFDVFPLRTSDAPWALAGVMVEPTGRTYSLATTQHHFLLEDRHPVQAGTLDAARRQPEAPPFMHHAHHSTEANLIGQWPYDTYKWGMAIDLTACTGCSACVTACQAENNIPVVGKDQVGRGREMHWLRIDTYYKDVATNPRAFHQPVACMHCEKAPCEVVCPVAATTHSDEGLNEMTYNRCVGTRYCSNNCPYKVRRFNFLQYSDMDTPVLKLLRNPNVTVRTRGVMEKCTYCVQRINAARVSAGNEDRAIRTSEIETACQAACPTQAIAFGNLNNSSSPVVQWKRSSLNYGLLEDLSTEPRTTYLAMVSNPNPAIEEDVEL